MAVLVGLLVFVGQPQAAVVIDFDSLTGSGDVYRGFTYVEDGYTLSNLASLNFRSVHPGSSRYTGSVSFFNATVSGVTQMTRTAGGGGPFDLLSIDLAELNASKVADVKFTGNLSGGGTVTQTFTLDGIAFAVETFDFTGFTNLQSVTWVQQSPYHQFDNIVVQNAIPEPSTLAALGGLLGIGLIGRWWKRRKVA